MIPWCHGNDRKNRGIRSHNVDFLGYMSPCLPWMKISIEKWYFVFICVAYNNSARKSETNWCAPRLFYYHGLTLIQSCIRGYIDCDDAQEIIHYLSQRWFSSGAHICVTLPQSVNKNIARHTAHTIVSWLNHKQWLVVHSSDLMMITIISYLLTIFIREEVKLKRTAP